MLEQLQQPTVQKAEDTGRCRREFGAHHETATLPRLHANDFTLELGRMPRPIAYAN